MEREPDPIRRKKRTRQHVIADLGVNFAERVVLLAGFTVDRFIHDYGIDLILKTYSSTGEVEAGSISIQVKATDHLKPHADGTTFPIRLRVADVKSWVMELYPVILIVYNAVEDRAYWLDVQEYARSTGIDDDVGGVTVTLRMSISTLFDQSAVVRIRERKESLAPPSS